MLKKVGLKRRMNYNFDEKEKGICEYCGKELFIYKQGYCKSCYKLMLKDEYLLNPNAKFTSTSQKDLVFDFLKNPRIDKKELAKKYGIAMRTVYYTINKYTIKIKSLS